MRKSNNRREEWSVASIRGLYDMHKESISGAWYFIDVISGINVLVAAMSIDEYGGSVTLNDYEIEKLYGFVDGLSDDDIVILSQSSQGGIGICTEACIDGKSYDITDYESW